MLYVKVLSKLQFDTHTPDPEAIAIRIIDPQGAKHSSISGYRDEIRLEFWDVENTIGKYAQISEQQAEQLYDFMLRHKDAERLVVHCMAGISRSNTVAQFFASHIAKDDKMASLVASAQGKLINYGVWDALKEQAIKHNNWHMPFTGKE